MGTIESLRPVKIEGTKTPIGGGAGAVSVVLPAARLAVAVAASLPL
jgi:outer membrane lipoprotein SlyB